MIAAGAAVRLCPLFLSPSECPHEKWVSWDNCRELMRGAKRVTTIITIITITYTENQLRFQFFQFARQFIHQLVQI